MARYASNPRTKQQGRYGEPRKKSSGFLRLLRDLLIIVAMASVLTFAIKSFLVRPFFIPSGSMTQTLQVNDKILVNLLPMSKDNVKRGDIVVFKDPGGWVYPAAHQNENFVQSVLSKIGFTPEASDEYVIKRVIGVGGDTVECCDANGLLTINGVPIKESYIYLPEGMQKVSELEFNVTVPEGSYWVMGDNRYASKDSRYNQDQPGKGFVSAENIVGKAFLINWPINRIGLIDNHEEVFAGVIASSGGE